MDANRTDQDRSEYLTGVFRDRESAERAYGSLHSRGYNKDDVNLAMSEDTRKKHFSKANGELGNKALEGAGVGSAVGGVVGATITGIAAAATAIAVPGLGLVVAGPIAGALAGGAVGGATGGIVGGLVGMGIPEDRAKKYEKHLKEGGILMGVRPRSREDADALRGDWQQYGSDITY
jgi:hypothetical protein